MDSPTQATLESRVSWDGDGTSLLENDRLPSPGGIQPLPATHKDPLDRKRQRSWRADDAVRSLPGVEEGCTSLRLRLPSLAGCGVAKGVRNEQLSSIRLAKATFPSRRFEDLHAEPVHRDEHDGDQERVWHQQAVVRIAADGVQDPNAGFRHPFRDDDHVPACEEADHGPRLQEPPSRPSSRGGFPSHSRRRRYDAHFVAQVGFLVSSRSPARASSGFLLLFHARSRCPFGCAS